MIIPCSELDEYAEAGRDSEVPVRPLLGIPRCRLEEAEVSSRDDGGEADCDDRNRGRDR